MTELNEAVNRILVPKNQPKENYDRHQMIIIVDLDFTQTAKLINFKQQN